MIKIKDIVGLPSLTYHVENGLSLSENVYRYSSDKFIQLFAEARDAWRDGLIELNEEDAQLLESTDIGEYGVFEGEKVPLDLPMVDEETVDYDFSKEELIRVIKQLKRGASTEIEMIKAFEKALGRELTDDEIRGFKLKEENIDEHHGDDFPKDLLDKTFNSFLNKLKKKNETDYNKVEDIVKKHCSVDEASMIGTGASFQAGAGEAYATPYAFKKKNKRKKD